MDLFTPESEDPNSPFSSGNDLSMIMEDSKETIDDVFSSSKETRPVPPPQFKVGMEFLCHLLFESLSLSLSLSLSFSPTSFPSSSQLGLSSRSDSNNGSADSVTTPTGGPATPSTTALASTDEPIHIINVAIKNDSSSSDEELVKKCYTFVQVHVLNYDL